MKYLVFTPSEKSKEVLKKYTKFWEETKKHIEVIHDDEPIDCRKDFMKIKLELDDYLPLGKTFNMLDMIIFVTSILEKMVNLSTNFFR